MHFAVIIFTIFCAWKWGDWKNWKKYHSTMLFIAMADLLYNFLYHDHMLWRYNQVTLGMSHTITELFCALIILPATGLILLTNYPNTVKGQFLRIIKFIGIYIFFELVYQWYGIIVYSYGWSIWWSLLWDCMMIPMWALHNKKPLLAYVASIVAVIIMLILFPTSFK